jgi:hypothetical protein
MQRLTYPVFAKHENGDVKNFVSMKSAMKWIIAEKFFEKIDSKKLHRILDNNTKIYGWTFEAPTRPEYSFESKGVRIACCVSLHHKDSGEIVYHKSLSQAAEWMNRNVEKMPFKMTHETISLRIKNRSSICGWFFEQIDEIPKDYIAPEKIVDPLKFVFGEEAAEAFRNKSVRITNENPVRVSVYDVIKVVSGNVNEHDTWKLLSATHPEVLAMTSKFHFRDGQGQRPTPVADMKGILHVVNLLPGANAAKFRNGTINLLIRFLGGDVTLKDTIDGINEFHESGAAESTVVDLVLPAPLTATMTTNKYALLSSTMVDMDLSCFKNKELVYLLIFECDGKIYIKFGRTTNIHNRMSGHFREIPGVQIYCLHESKDAQGVEGKFKEKMKYMGYLTEVIVNGKKQTEILHGITATEAEQFLVTINKEESNVPDVDNMDGSNEYKIAQLNAEVRIKEIEERKSRSQALFDLLKNNPEFITPDLLMKLASN